MVRRIVRLSVVFLLLAAVSAVALLAYFRATAIPIHEFDHAWYNTPREWSETLARTFRSEQRWAVARAEVDHFVSPIGPSRAIQLYYASPDPSGDTYLRFGSCWLTSSADLHLLPVYRWSSREHRFLWKALEDHSP